MKEKLTIPEEVEQLKKENVSLMEQIDSQDKIINQQEAVIRKQDEKIKLLEQHILHLDNKLRKYVNENTPSSKKPDWDSTKSPDRINKEKKPLGKPKDSNGATRPTPKIEEEEMVRLYEYENYLGEPIDYAQRIVCEIPQLPKIKWKLFYLALYKDPATGVIITATHPECPKEGGFGPNLKTQIAILRESLNISEEKTIQFLESLYRAPLTAGTVESELDRVANILTPLYNTILEKIDDAYVKYSDETGQSVNGNNWCLYCFSTSEESYFFAEEKKKAEHIKNRLDLDLNKVLGCDGHSIYSWCPVKQRCWSHLTRKEKWLIDEKQTYERKFLHESVSGTFKLSGDILGKGPPGHHHLWDVLLLRNRLWQAVNYKWSDEKCQKVANYIRNGWDSWFTFMFVAGVEPTNNIDERAIRKHVMKRKNSGAFRSKKGLDNHCIILSVLETWRKNGGNEYDELNNVIRLYNSAISW